MEDLHYIFRVVDGQPLFRDAWGGAEGKRS